MSTDTLKVLAAAAKLPPDQVRARLNTAMMTGDMVGLVFWQAVRDAKEAI